MPEGALSARTGEEFLWRLQVKVPFCMQHHHNTNTGQTTKKQTNMQEPLARPNTHLTYRQARCGSINILGPLPPQASWASGSSRSRTREEAARVLRVFPYQIHKTHIFLKFIFMFSKQMNDFFIYIIFSNDKIIISNLIINIF